MSLFDFFRKQEVIYYRNAKKKLNQIYAKEKITISSLRERILTIEHTIERINKSELHNLNNEHKEDNEIKILAFQKLLKEAKVDFIEGVTLKYNEIGENQIPTSYEKCLTFSRNYVNKKYSNRWIELEEIVNFKFK
jgi:hypothetical protein